MRILREGLLAGLVLASLAGTATAAAQARLPEPSDAFRIGPEDMLAISVWQNAELSRVVPVRPDGRISLPLVGEILAAGLTPPELATAIEKRLEEYAPNAVVSVIVSEVNSFTVSVLGRVQRPDRFKLRAPTTVLEILALAGGFQEEASPDDIVVMRPEAMPTRGRSTGKLFRRIRFNYKKVISAGGETENFSLQAGDIVVVP